MNQIDIDRQREAMRIAALYSLGIHGGERFVIFDRLVHLATDFFHIPMATIALIDETRQIYFAKARIESEGSTREESICTHTIANDKMLVIRDLATDPQWCARSFNVGDVPLRFYAGMPIHVSGQPVGTFCLLDDQPRPFFDQTDMHLLESLALIAEDLLTMLRLRRDFERLQGSETSARTPDRPAAFNVQ